MPRVPIPVRNALGYAVPELFWGSTWALTVDGPMVPAFKADFGGSEGFVGLAWLLGAAGLGLVSWLSAYWVAPLKHKRAFVFWGHVAGGAVLLLIALMLHLAPGDAAARTAYLAGITLFFVSVGLLMPGWLALVGELFRHGTQSRVLGITFLANRLAAALTGQFVARAVLRSAGSATEHWTLLFGLAGILGVVGSLPFLWIVEHPPVRAPRVPFRAYARSVLDVLRELKALRRFVAADAVGITVMLTLAFYADAGIRQDGFHNSWAGHWVTIGAIAQLSGSGLIALAGDAVKPRTWLVLGVLCGAGASLAAARGGSLLAYELAAAGMGIYMAARASCHAPQVMRLAPDRDGTAPIGVAVALIMPVQGLLPWAADRWMLGTPHGYDRVFLAAAAMGLLCAILLLRWVPRGVGNCAATGSAPTAG